MGISAALGSSALLPAGLGFRNKLINGDFRINQRGFSSTTSNVGYGYDRWALYTAGGGATYSAQTFTAGNAIVGQEPQNFARIVTTGQTATSTYTVLTQRIEDVRNCAGQTTTVSFWAKAASGTPKVSIEFAQNFGSGGSAEVLTYAGQVTLSTSWQRFTVTATVPSISGKTLGTENTHSLGLFLWVSGGSDFNSRTGSIGIQSNTFDFWGVQLEQNYQPTPFEQRPIGVELQPCQRYYEKSYDIATSPGTATSTGRSLLGISSSGTGYMSMSVPFAVEKRAAPDVTIYDLAGTSGKITYGTNNQSGTVTDISTRQFRVYSDNTTSKNEISWQWVAQKEL